MSRVVRIKPHHFVDILAAYGAGAETFMPDRGRGHALHRVAESLLKERDALLELELGIDDICQPCRHSQSGVCDDWVEPIQHGTASKHEYNLKLDQRWCGCLELAQGSSLSARRFCELIQERLGEVERLYRQSRSPKAAQAFEDLKRGAAKYLQTP